MIKDRGIIKFTAMMLPEHKGSLKQLLEDEKKIPKPILDEQRIEEIETIILNAMEFNESLIFQVYKKGALIEVVGTTHYIDHLNKELRIKDDKDKVHLIKFNNIVHVHNS
ncbi:YolD-like family protein [Metabacillus fastidiosus]|uniref:YolD-like family protein n=1 Tax=Metabacillus fastidiosus TaxID=1458 RepID=UPI002E1E7E48|nr:YolD-like family protein [Metabacillus fastidiosus]